MIDTFSDQPSWEAWRQAKLDIYHFCEQNNLPNFGNEGKVALLPSILLQEMQHVAPFQIGGHQRTLKLMNNIWHPCPTVCWPKKSRKFTLTYSTDQSQAQLVVYYDDENFENGDGNAPSNYQTRRGETPRKLKMKHSAMRENLQSLCENFSFDKNSLFFSCRDRTVHSMICPFRAWRRWFRIPPFLSLPSRRLP